MDNITTGMVTRDGNVVAVNRMICREGRLFFPSGSVKDFWSCSSWCVWSPQNGILLDRGLLILQNIYELPLVGGSWFGLLYKNALLLNTQ